MLREESGSIVKLYNLTGDLLKDTLFLGEMTVFHLGVLINFLYQELFGK